MSWVTFRCCPMTWCGKYRTLSTRRESFWFDLSMKTLSTWNILGRDLQNERKLVICLCESPLAEQSARILFVGHVSCFMILSETIVLQLFQKYWQDMKFCRQVLNDSLHDVHSKDCKSGTSPTYIFPAMYYILTKHLWQPVSEVAIDFRYVI